MSVKPMSGSAATADVAEKPASARGKRPTRPRGGDYAERRREPELIPLFPVAPFVPSSSCAHKIIYRNSKIYCPICHRSGCDHWGALQRNPRTDPKGHGDPPPVNPRKKLTRREKRALLRDYRMRADTLTDQELSYLRGLGVPL